MRPEQKSKLLLGVTRSKAKMLEYSVPEEHHIKITQDPSKLFTLTIGLLGDLAAEINREELQPEGLLELRKNLLFSARFFDAYLQSKLNESLDPYLVLLGSASYYLSDLPGSATVLAKRINGDCPNLEGEGLEDLLLWLLKADLTTYFEGSEGPFGDHIDSISKCVLQFFRDGIGEENLIVLATTLRDAAYDSGTPRQLLFGDVIAAILRKKIENSSWKALPLYSGLPRDKWLYALQKESFIKELWPAQHLLGQAGVLKGDSAIVQMPTSAGKTKATELVIRSAFLAERTSLAIIIAPFRALCHEIKNSLISAFHNESSKVDELSDALQTDFEIAELLGHHQILVITPEKLLYVLRHAPELATNVGLLIFDEGHQFDSGTRGITYELLLTSLRSMLPVGAQKVLISAVISNAEDVGEWLNGDPKTVEGQGLLPTYRSVAFASFIDLRGSAVKTGWMKYVQPQSPDDLDYFVPQVIEKITLARKKGESLSNVKYFPNSSNGKEIAIFLGLRLVPEGAVAVFCGRKDTASGLCEIISERFSRNLSMVMPKEYSDQNEVSKLSYLIGQNLGANAPATQVAQIGVFSHHGNTPHGIRLSIEFAMREGLVRFVICTSTLAQGVNLPIRYLIVTSVYQGIERIKVRDFHNLIGRVARAGMHTEGSVLFADPIVYDKRKNRKDMWRWDQVKELLDPSNSEPCISNLLSIFNPIKSDDDKYTINTEALDFVRAYISDPNEVATLADQIASEHGDKGFSREGVERQVSWKISLISSIESFLLSHWDEGETSFSEADVVSLAEETLAFFLADEQKREHIRDLFKILAQNISVNITDPGRRRIYGGTLYGVMDAQSIERWVEINVAPLMAANNKEQILNIVWPLLAAHIHNRTFRRFDKPNALKEITHAWIEGKSFHDLLGTIQHKKVKMIWGSQRRDFKIDHVVDICEGGLAYDGSLLIGALIEFVDLIEQGEAGQLISQLQLFQKQLKYGLPSLTAIVIYEMGFSDRVIAQELGAFIDGFDRKTVTISLQIKKVDVLDVLGRYPSYFLEEIYEKLE